MDNVVQLQRKKEDACEVSSPLAGKVSGVGGGGQRLTGMLYTDGVGTVS